ncbi:uncharacterized protein [Aegilops tauschii subsp. strangulata]|uniref:uncharacterized protein isoform X2 n=1 Tax=Aegilops tauschii subsp. strangulata TaxID=200361 RepID=UPI003CC8661B
MEFLMQPFNRTLIEEVNDSNVRLQPLHYPVVSLPGGDLPPASSSSADAQICATAAVAAEAGSADKAQTSERSIEKIDPKTPGLTCRVRIGAAAPGRAPCPDSMTTLEKSVRVFAEAPGDNVIVPKIGTSFGTLGQNVCKR